MESQAITFSEALDFVKKGATVKRKGEKGIIKYIKGTGKFSVGPLDSPSGLVLEPLRVKSILGVPAIYFNGFHDVNHGTMPMLVKEENKVLQPYTPSALDLFAEDWEIVSFELYGTTCDTAAGCNVTCNESFGNAAKSEAIPSRER